MEDLDGTKYNPKIVIPKFILILAFHYLLFWAINQYLVNWVFLPNILIVCGLTQSFEMCVKYLVHDNVLRRFAIYRWFVLSGGAQEEFEHEPFGWFDENLCVGKRRVDDGDDDDDECGLIDGIPYVYRIHRVNTQTQNIDEEILPMIVANRELTYLLEEHRTEDEERERYALGWQSYGDYFVTSSILGS